jgi:hypothetical protein
MVLSKARKSESAETKRGKGGRGPDVARPRSLTERNLPEKHGNDYEVPATIQRTTSTLISRFRSAERLYGSCAACRETSTRTKTST